MVQFCLHPKMNVDVLKTGILFVSENNVKLKVEIIQLDPHFTILLHFFSLLNLKIFPGLERINCKCLVRMHEWDFDDYIIPLLNGEHTVSSCNSH